jgi:hypothetical protein
MFSSKPAWYLPFTILTVTFVLYASSGLWFSQWMVGSDLIRSPSALDSILSRDTTNTLYNDARLHNTLLSFTETVAKASSDYGSTYHLDGLRSFGTNLTENVRRIRARHFTTRKAKRQGLISDMLSGGETRGGIFEGLLGGTGNDTGGLSDLFGKAINGLTGDLVGALAAPAYFLGIGLG